jgi:hypothetical protein
VLCFESGNRFQKRVIGNLAGLRGNSELT